MSAFDKYKSAVPPQAAPAAQSAGGSAFDKYKSATPAAPAPTEAPKTDEKQGISRAELEEIAAKHGTDPDTLERLAPTFGSRVTTDKPIEDESTVTAKRIYGEIGENTLLGLPQFIVKKGLKPNERAAIEDVQERIKSRQKLLSLDTLVDIAGSAPTFAVTGIAAGAKTIPQLAREGIKAVAPAINKAAMAAGATSAVKGGLEAREGEALKGAAKAGVAGYLVGGLFGTGIAAASRGKDAVKNKVVNTLEDWAEKEGVRLEEKVAKARAPLLEQQNVLGKQVINNDTAGVVEKEALDAEQVAFARFINRSEGKKSLPSTPEEARSLINTAKATEGEEFLSKKWNNYQDVEAAEKELRKDLDVLNSPKGRFFDRALKFSIDNRPAAVIVDKKNGTKLLIDLDNLSQANKHYATEMSSFVPTHKELKDLSSGMDLEKITGAMRAQDISTLEPQEQMVAARLKEVFEQRRLRANELGVPIQKLKVDGKEVEFYVPDQLKEPIDAILAVKNKIRTVNNELTKINKKPTDIRNLDGEEYTKAVEYIKKNHDDLFGAMRTLTHLKDVESSPYSFNAGLKALVSPPKLSELMDMEASAAFSRQGIIPEFLKETDPLKMLQNWERDTFRHAYYRDGLESLRTTRLKLLAADDGNGAALVQQLINDLTGRTKGMAKATRDVLQTIALNARERLELGKGNKAVNTLLAKAPDYFFHVTNQVYPNFLGWNPKSAMQNATQPILMTIPEIGAKYGTELFGKAYFEAAKEMRTNPNFAKSLRERGIIGANWNQELSGALEKGMLDGFDNPAAKALIKGNKVLNQVGMAMFEAAENLNRYTTDKAARMMAKDFMGGNKDAIKYFSTLPSSYKNEIVKAVKAKDTQKVEDLFSQQLIAKTMFNYDRITMSEFGRWLGPGLSSFIKWPSSIAGDVAATLKTKDAKTATKDLTRRYVAPLAFVMLAEQAALDDETKESGVYRALFGKGGASQGAPINVLKGVVEGKVAQPPIVSTISKGLSAPIAATQGDFEPAWQWLNNTAYSYTPQAGLIRFMVNDIPLITTGEQPKGTISNKVQRALTGEGTLDSFFKKEK